MKIVNTEGEREREEKKQWDNEELIQRSLVLQQKQK